MSAVAADVTTVNLVIRATRAGLPESVARVVAYRAIVKNVAGCGGCGGAGGVCADAAVGNNAMIVMVNTDFIFIVCFVKSLT